MDWSNPAVLTLLGTVFGGAGLKIVEKILSKGRDRIDDARDLRIELRSDIASLRAELVKAETELDRWRDRYYALLDEHSKVKAELDAALRRIESSASSAASEAGRAKKALDSTYEV